MLRHIKIGEPNVNCAYIPLNPTFYIRKATKWIPTFFLKTHTNDLLGLALLMLYLYQCQILVGWVEVTKPNIKMNTYNLQLRN